MNHDEDDTCPICGFHLYFVPWRGASASFGNCPCCGNEFGYHDDAAFDDPVPALPDAHRLLPRTLGGGRHAVDGFAPPAARLGSCPAAGRPRGRTFGPDVRRAQHNGHRPPFRRRRHVPGVRIPARLRPVDRHVAVAPHLPQLRHPLRVPRHAQPRRPPPARRRTGTPTRTLARARRRMVQHDHPATARLGPPAPAAEPRSRLKRPLCPSESARSGRFRRTEPRIRFPFPGSRCTHGSREVGLDGAAAGPAGTVRADGGMRGRWGTDGQTHETAEMASGAGRGHGAGRRRVQRRRRRAAVTTLPGDPTTVTTTPATTAASPTTAERVTTPATTPPPPTLAPLDALKAQIAADYVRSSEATDALTRNPTLENLEAVAATIRAPDSPSYTGLIELITDLVATGDRIAAGDPDYSEVRVEQVDITDVDCRRGDRHRLSRSRTRFGLTRRGNPSSDASSCTPLASEHRFSARRTGGSRRPRTHFSKPLRR